MTGDEVGDDADAEPSSVDPLLAVYRHDVHKLRGRSHKAAVEEVAGQRVNESVPRGADGDAALLSRARGDPEQTVANHASPYRVSLRTGAPVVRETDFSEAAIEAAVRDLVTIRDAAAAHRAWLDSVVAALFNESVYYPYTSLKYHVVLAAALLDNYRAGHAFEDLYLVVDAPGADLVPHRTVFASSVVVLRLTGDPDGCPGACVGAGPARSFADVWSRLPVQALPVHESRWWRVVDAQVRRVRSWSTALQYLDDCVSHDGTARGTGGERRAE